MALAEATILARYDHWQVFGTGTFTGSRTPSALSERRLVFAFLYEVARLSGVPFGGLVWSTRRELGELGGRVHYHWLIGAKGWTVTKGQCFTMNSLWDDMPRCGFSRNHRFDPALNGVEYVTKCLSSGAAGGLGGDYYEGSKFASGKSEVELSNSLSHVIGGKRIGELRHCNARG